ncbi:MAG: hypothetical protein ACPGWM_07590 [Flavobacteriales bacterium]
MKKIIIMMMLIIPVGLMAQMEKVKGKNSTEVAGSKVFGEIIIQDFQGSTSVKLGFGKTIETVSIDKMIMKDVEALGRMKFNSVSDALNTISSFGWDVEFSYDVTVRTGTITTIVISKDGQMLRKAEAPSKTIPQKGSKGKK